MLTKSNVSHFNNLLTNPDPLSPKIIAGFFEQYSKILVAVSGGSDSIALLSLLANSPRKNDILAATVDHGLRSEAAIEAQMVRTFCEQQSIPHQTLIWRPKKATSAEARAHRYQLLFDYAKSTGSQAVALGHTHGDQAETVLMRATRSTRKSSNRGLAGMSVFSSYEKAVLVRPLLGSTRIELQDYLRERNISWINDPSNDQIQYERIQVREKLKSRFNKRFSSNLVRLASLSGRTRHWLNQQAATCISQHAAKVEDNKIALTNVAQTSLPVISEALATLIQVLGGQSYKPSPDKFQDILHSLTIGKTYQKAVGRVLIEVKNGGLILTREKRNLLQEPPNPVDGQVYDNRFRFEVASNGTVVKRPYIVALEKFRPSWDDSLYVAVVDVIDAPNIQANIHINESI